MTLLELLVKELPKRGGWPEGAVSCMQSGVDNELYFQGGCIFTSRILLEFHAEDEETAEVKREQYEAAIAAQHPVWDGEGLPPVGLLVELMDDSQSQTWGNVTIKYYGDSFAVWDDNGEECSNSLCHVKVRPILTEAERKRKEVINAIALAYDTQDNAGNYRAATGVYEDIAAGKIPGVEISK